MRAVVIAVIAVGVLAAGAGPASAATEYRFVGKPLIFEGTYSYTAIFRVTPDVPRKPNFHTIGVGVLKGQESLLYGGGRRPRCYMAVFGTSRVGTLRHGLRYRFTVRAGSGAPVSVRAPVARRTRGYEDLSAWEDPKSARLCR